MSIAAVNTDQAGHGSVPIFYDASRRRWFGFSLVSSALGIFVAVLLGMLGLAIVETPTIRPVPLASPVAAVASLPNEPSVDTGALVRRPAQMPLAVTATVVMASTQGESTVDAVVEAVPDPISLAEIAVATPPLPRPRPAVAPLQLVLADQHQRQPPPPASLSSPSFTTLGGGNGGTTVTLGTSGSFVTLGRPQSDDMDLGAVEPTLLDTVLGTLFAVLAPPVAAQEFTASPVDPEIQAFHVNWDQASASSLAEHIRNIDILLPEWITLRDEQGAVTVERGQRTQQTLALRDDAHPDLQIMPVLTNFADGAWQAERLRSVLRSPEAANRLAASVIAYLVDNDFDGLTLRFVGLAVDDRADHLRFLRLLKPLLEAEGLRLQHVVNIEGGALDATLFADLVDVLIVEIQGQTTMAGSPGPMASQLWFEERLASWRRRISADKLVFAIANFALDWKDGETAEAISVLEAFRRAEWAGGEIALDVEALNNRFTYTAEDGRHTVWMLDGVSAFNQMRSLAAVAPHGIALNRLGTEDASIWQILSDPYGASAAALEQIDYKYQIARNGVGEVIKLVDLPRTGRRSLSLEAGLIRAAKVDLIPRAYEIDHWGASDAKLVALTFDDGPDPTFTPQVLDILARYDVSATFFAVGAQMLRHPELVERVVAEGHEVGSHTYSHVNISTMSADMLRLDLNATQRVFESITGRQMAMFRAPYAVDANPITPSQIAPLETVGAMGYVTVNMNIDPVDWWLPNKDRIVSDTVDGILEGGGNIVLLHDGGGPRQATVDALPEIIETLQARGYRFVAVSELIGLSADEVMPYAPADLGWQTLAQTLGFALLREGEKLIVGLFLLAIGLGIARSVILITLAAFRRPHRRLPPAQDGLRVGVIVPAYNEEKVVLKTVQSLLQSDYSNLKILVVDDGSKDQTYAICRDAFAEEPRVEVVTKPNGGKAAALNFGFRMLDVDVVVALDADTIFMPDTISRLVGHFHDDRVVAVAGNAKVGNRLNMLTRWQALEYITAQNLDRRAFDLLNCITVVPGAVGAWWRDTVIELGGYSTDTLAEDADLTIRILRAGYKVTYEEGAIALTEAPETTHQLFKQRFRWMFGMLQVTQKHRGALALRDSKAFALIGMPNILLFQIVFPLLAPLADLVALGILIGLGAQMITGSSVIGLTEALIFLALFGAFILLDLLAAAVAFWHERREDWRLLPWLLPQRFYYRQLLYLVAIKATLTAVRGTMVGWGNLQRSASVPALGSAGVQYRKA
ncbi:glycosyltransferase [Devosia sp. XJ19-1]|uniref:glycosyltransferase n=1 Tax=Devosia ureilytica TaxID=2952754 RepID=UPI0020C78467|nr:glycosyltransferase [Devosia ureilytica]MCP8883868.1 glycosyltransferase [Devosia ureilytica]